LIAGKPNRAIRVKGTPGIPYIKEAERKRIKSWKSERINWFKALTGAGRKKYGMFDAFVKWFTVKIMRALTARGVPHGPLIVSLKKVSDHFQ
jgi:hypothetical protein